MSRTAHQPKFPILEVEDTLCAYPVDNYNKEAAHSTHEAGFLQVDNQPLHEGGKLGINPRATDPPLKLGPDQSPPDIDDDAQFWSTYDRVSTAFDREFLDAWNKSLDVLLIFAGLFSAINTAFIIESYKGLQADPAQTTNDLLRLFISHRSDNFTLSYEDLHPGSPESTAVSTNSFFFSSLSFSLTAAFGAVTAKQWLTEYSNVGAVKSLYIQGRKRQEKYQGMKRWHLQFIIEVLPMILQMSLLLFLIGVVHFLWMIDRNVATVQLVLSGAGVLIYLLTIVIGILVPSSPFQSPLSRHLYRIYQDSNSSLKTALSKIQTGYLIKPLRSAVDPLLRSLATSRHLPRIATYISLWNAQLRSMISRSDSPKIPTLPVEAESTEWDHEEVVAAESVVWLLEHAEHPDVTITALGAVPRLPAALVLTLIKASEGLLERLIEFHNDLLPFASFRGTRVGWSTAWADTSVVSGMALHHILRIETLKDQNTEILSKLDLFVGLEGSSYTLGEGVDSLAATKIALLMNLELLDPNPFSANKELRSFVAYSIIRSADLLSPPSDLLRLDFKDKLRAYAADHLVMPINPTHLALEALIRIACRDFILPSDRRIDLPRPDVTHFLLNLLERDASRNTVSYAAITVAAIHCPPIQNGENQATDTQNQRPAQPTILARCYEQDKSGMILDNVALAFSFIRYAGDQVAIFRTLLKLTSDLFHEEYYLPDEPIPFADFHLHLLHLAQQSPNDSQIQRIIAELLCLCPDGSWVVAGESGTLVYAVLESVPVTSEEFTSRSRVIHGILLDKMVRNAIDTDLLHNTDLHSALKRYCRSLFYSSGMSSQETSFEFLIRMLKTFGERSTRSNLDLLDAQMHYVLTHIKTDLLGLDWDSLGHITVEFLNDLLARHDELRWPAYFNSAGLITGRTASDETYQLPLRTLEPHGLLSILQTDWDKRNLWYGEAIMLLWSVAKSELRKNGWQSDLYDTFFDYRTVSVMGSYWDSIKNFMESHDFPPINHVVLKDYVQVGFKYLDRAEGNDTITLSDRDLFERRIMRRILTQIVEEMEESATMRVVRGI